MAAMRTQGPNRVRSNNWRHSPLNSWLSIAACAFAISTLSCESRQVSHVLRYDVGDTIAGPADAEDVESLLTTINGRLRGKGYASAVGEREIAVDVYGPLDEKQLALVRQRIESVGELGFFLLAAENAPADADAIARAKQLPADEKRVLRDGEIIAKWVPYDSRDFGPSVEADGRVVTRIAGDTSEVLVLHGPHDVTGDSLLLVRRDDDGHGNATFNFAFNEPGSVRMHALSSAHLPDPETGEMRYLAVVFDGKLISAPAIVTTISQQGQISGKTLTADQIDVMIAVLEEGKLPAAIKEKRGVSTSP
jgi:preprotein translocase subunit SecD